MWRKIGALVLTTTSLLGFAACSDDADGGTGLGLGGDGSLRAQLAGLPAEAVTGEGVGALVYLADFAAARDQLDLEAPGADASDDAFTDYVLALTGASEHQGGLPWPEGLSRQRVIDARADYEQQFGISLAAVDGFAEVVAPPRMVTVASGEFSGDRIGDAVESDPTWSDDLETAEHGGTTYWSWLEDSELDVERVDELHPLGEATRLALVDDRLVRTRTTADMEATIDALAGDGSLADDEVLASLAEGLDGAGAVAGMLTTDVSGFTVEGLAGAGATPEIVDELQDLPTLAPYQGLAIGIAFGDGGVEDSFMVVVLDHADARAAEDNVERFEQIATEGTSVLTDEPWSERFEIDSVEADGTRVVARLAVEIPALWLGIIPQRDSLLVHD